MMLSRFVVFLSFPRFFELIPVALELASKTFSGSAKTRLYTRGAGARQFTVKRRQSDSNASIQLQSLLRFSLRNILNSRETMHRLEVDIMKFLYSY